MNEKRINNAYENAKEVYSELGINTDDVLKKMDEINISMHCWQGDDVTGLEVKEEKFGDGGILATGNYPGKAENGEQLRQDIDMAMDLLPGKQKLNLHACYAETDGKFVERNELKTEHFKKWLDWAKEKEIGLDFNPTFFGHKYSSDGFTLSSSNEEIRSFWIRHAKACRKIAEDFGRELGIKCINNIWVPDGMKDLPADRLAPRQRLRDSLDTIFEDKLDNKYLGDAIECKLFGIGSESYVVGSHEFYTSYAIKNDKMLCLDAGHFHPTETISDKISSILTFSDEILLHVSRGVRWDSDHVVLLNDDLLSIMHEIKRSSAFGKVNIALDFFDASINRISAWVIGTRAAQKGILTALLEPTEILKKKESDGDYSERLALMEEFKMLPVSAVWDKYCMDSNVPVGIEWISKVKKYEEEILKKRG
jgi:L-rhamnose isomerase